MKPFGTTIWTCELSGGGTLLDEFDRALSLASQTPPTAKKVLPSFKYTLLLRNVDNSVVASAFAPHVTVDRATAEREVHATLSLLMRTKVYQPPPFALQCRTTYVRDFFERGPSFTLVGTVDGEVDEARFDWAVSEIDFLINRTTYRCVVEAQSGDAVRIGEAESEFVKRFTREFEQHKMYAPSLRAHLSSLELKLAGRPQGQATSSAMSREVQLSLEDLVSAQG